MPAECTASDQPWPTPLLWIARRYLYQRRRYASWSPASRVRLRFTRDNLPRQLAGRLYRCCAHLKGHGGVKGTFRRLARCASAFRFGTGFERELFHPGNSQIAPQGGAKCGALVSGSEATHDEALREVIDAWPELPAGLQQAILTIVRAGRDG